MRYCATLLFCVVYLFLAVTFARGQTDGDPANYPVNGTAEVYGSGWNADPVVPAKNDIYDYLHQLDTDDDGDVDNVDASVGSAPSAATYITQVPDSGLYNEQALNGTSDGGLEHTSGVISSFTLTAAGKALLDDANTSVQRSTLGLDKTANATASGAYYLGVFDEFGNSASSNTQAVLNDLDAALDLRCLESVFGISLKNRLSLNGTALDVSSALEKYHGVDPSADVLAMLGSADDTALVTEIGAEPALTDEASLYSTLSDVSQFYEPGDNITTSSGTTLPATCQVGQTFLDTDYDTDGLRCECVSTNTWKCGQSVPADDKILEDDSSWEIIDGGTGRADCKIDDNRKVRINSTGMEINGTINAEGFETDATEHPKIRSLDSNCPGTDEHIGEVAWEYIDGGDGAENGGIYLRTLEGGANTTQMQYTPAAGWEIPSGKNLALLGGSIAGRVPVGSDITGNYGLNTTALHGKFYIVTAACTVTLDKVTDVGFGASVMLFIRDAAETCIVEVDDADKINLHGTPLDAGDTIDSPGNAGDFICLISHTDVDGSGTDGWITLGYGESAWADGGAS